ncbi:lysophospholipid acyltransferase family protein [Archangium lansingense]
MLQSPSAVWLHRLVRRMHRIEAQGLERIPQQGRVILAVNHTGLGVRSGLLLSTLLERDITFLASTVMRRLPFSRQLARTFSVIFVSPADMLSTRLLDEAEAVLGRGALLGLMVDGREMNQRKGMTKRGAAWLAIRLGASLLPVSVRFGLTGNARVQVGELLPPPPSVSRQDLDASTAALHDFHRTMSR